MNSVKIISSLLLAASVLTFGCAKEQNPVESADGKETQPPVEDDFFTCYLDEGLNSTEVSEEPATSGALAASGTKTALQSDGKVFWSAGDTIVLYGFVKYVTHESGARVKFVPVDPDLQYAPAERAKMKAPYNAYYGCEFEKVGSGYMPVLPAVQKYVEGSFCSNPMYSISNDRTLRFKNLCSVLQLSLSGNGLVKTIKVTDSDRYLSGRFSVDNEGNAVLNAQTGSHSVTIDLGEGVELTGAARKFYVAVPAGNYSSLVITLTDARGNIRDIRLKSGVTKTFARSTKYTIAKSIGFINILSGTMPAVGDPIKIYDGKANNTYMYGPTIFTNADGSIDTWWASSGGLHSPGDTLWNDSEPRKASRIKSEITRIYGNYFKTDKPFYSVFARLATYGRKDQVCLMSIYNWRGSVQATVNEAPVHTVMHATSPVSGRTLDNRWMPVFKSDNIPQCAVQDADMLPAGEYFVAIRPADFVRDTSLAIYYHETTVPSSVRPHKSSCWQGVWTGNVGGKDTSGSWSEMAGVQFEIAVNSSTRYIDVAYWDQVKYRHSVNGGQTWTDPQVSMKPTYNARDHFASCDPSLVKIGEYYYLAYTGTESNDDFLNDIYIARSKSVLGPWEKWSWNGGNGAWGHYCDPVVVFDGDSRHFGIGEPSMVYKDGSLYFYFQLVQGTNRCTKVIVVNNVTNDLQWPLRIYSLHVTQDSRFATAFVQSPGFGQVGSADSADIKYCDNDGKFYAVFTYDRFTQASKVALMRSDNGISFSYIGNIAGPLVPELHNCGMSGTPEGHFDYNQPQYIGYAQGGQDSGNWGAWPSYWHQLNW